MFGLLDVVEHDLHPTPLSEAEAVEWLENLNRSPLAFHLDDEPLLCMNAGSPAYDVPTSEFLLRGVAACRALLGEATMWAVYHRFQKAAS